MLNYKVEWISKEDLELRSTKKFLMIYYNQDHNLKVATNVRSLEELVGLSELLKGIVRNSYEEVKVVE